MASKRCAFVTRLLLSYRPRTETALFYAGKIHHLTSPGVQRGKVCLRHCLVYIYSKDRYIPIRTSSLATGSELPSCRTPRAYPISCSNAHIHCSFLQCHARRVRDFSCFCRKSRISRIPLRATTPLSQCSPSTHWHCRSKPMYD